ncbi:MAG: MBL fold metallo-hydrolase [Bacillota bacterium]
MLTKLLSVGAAVVTAGSFLWTTACAAGREAAIRWFGHACFLITSPTGIRVLTDPFDATVGYPVPAVEADVVTVSHEHFDHNNVSAVRGKPAVLRGKGEYQGDGIRIYPVASFHDTEGGAKRGANSIFVMEMGGIRLVHMGDLGHDLSRRQLDAIGRIDVLLVPVGGTYTIDAAGARRLVEETSPRAAIPMHYRTPVVGIPIAGVDEFLAGCNNVVRCDSNEVRFSEGSLPRDTTVYVMSYK